MIGRRTTFQTVLVLAASSAVFGANPTEVLKRSEVADKYVSYRGMKAASVWFAGRLENAVLKTVHLKPDKTRTEFFAPDMLAGIIVIRQGESCWKYSPKADLWRECPCSATPLNALRIAHENYDIRLIGTDKVAGRQAYAIHAVPKRRGEAVRRVWVDKESYVILGTQTEDRNGSVVNSSRFTTIELNPDDIRACIFEVKGRIKRAPKSVTVTFPITRPAYMPEGYRFVGTSSLSIGGYCCAHLQFSNGASIISLFQRPAHRHWPPTPTQSNITNVLTWSRHGKLFTLMGDLPRAELQKIADSTR